ARTSAKSPYRSRAAGPGASGRGQDRALGGSHSRTQRQNRRRPQVQSDAEARPSQQGRVSDVGHSEKNRQASRKSLSFRHFPNQPAGLPAFYFSTAAAASSARLVTIRSALASAALTAPAPGRADGRFTHTVAR